MQYAWAFFNTLCAMFGVWVYLLWNEAVVGVHRDRRVFRQKVTVEASFVVLSKTRFDCTGLWTLDRLAVLVHAGFVVEENSSILKGVH